MRKVKKSSDYVAQLIAKLKTAHKERDPARGVGETFQRREKNHSHSLVKHQTRRGEYKCAPSRKNPQ